MFTTRNIVVALVLLVASAAAYAGPTMWNKCCLYNKVCCPNSVCCPSR